MLTSGRITYLDSSAVVKLVVNEAESVALAAYLRGKPEWMSCDLALVEVARAVKPRGLAAVNRATRAVNQLSLIHLTQPLLETAGAVDPVQLRSLDAIHIAAALALGDALGEIVTYDNRMADAARALGLRVAMPGRN